ncbi:MAG: hypothetical protein AAF125_17655, partial [Chloroflexota bacterium]
PRRLPWYYPLLAGAGWFASSMTYIAIPVFGLTTLPAFWWRFGWPRRVGWVVLGVLAVLAVAAPSYNPPLLQSIYDGLRSSGINIGFAAIHAFGWVAVTLITALGFVGVDMRHREKRESVWQRITVVAVCTLLSAGIVLLIVGTPELIARRQAAQQERIAVTAVARLTEQPEYAASMTPYYGALIAEDIVRQGRATPTPVNILSGSIEATYDALFGLLTETPPPSTPMPSPTALPDVQCEPFLSYVQEDQAAWDVSSVLVDMGYSPAVQIITQTVEAVNGNCDAAPLPARTTYLVSLHAENAIEMVLAMSYEERLQLIQAVVTAIDAVSLDRTRTSPDVRLKFSVRGEAEAVGLITGPLDTIRDGLARNLTLPELHQALSPDTP